jgi:hypothetical protein
MAECVWMDRDLVAFAFLEWDERRSRRRIKFVALRNDKDAHTVTREGMQ